MLQFVEMYFFIGHIEADTEPQIVMWKIRLPVRLNLHKTVDNVLK